MPTNPVAPVNSTPSLDVLQACRERAPTEVWLALKRPRCSAALAIVRQLLARHPRRVAGTHLGRWLVVFGWSPPRSTVKRRITKKGQLFDRQRAGPELVVVSRACPWGKQTPWGGVEYERGSSDQRLGGVCRDCRGDAGRHARGGGDVLRDRIRTTAADIRTGAPGRKLLDHRAASENLRHARIPGRARRAGREESPGSDRRAARRPWSAVLRRPLLRGGKRLRWRRPPVQLGKGRRWPRAQGALHQPRRRDDLRSRVGDRGGQAQAPRGGDHPRLSAGR